MIKRSIRFRKWLLKFRRRQKKQSINGQNGKKEIKRKRLTYFRHPVVFFISTLMMMIILIPTMIVIFASPKSDEQTMNDMPNIKSDEIVNEEMTVPVMRTKTNMIETVPLEQYVIGVVASEMPAEFELEALKAQALAARTFVINQLNIGEENVTISDTVNDQVYNDESELRELFGTDYSWKMEKINKAVLETKGKILTYDNEPITPAFFSTSNGYTENSEDYWESELPYLRSVESKWDEISPKFLSQQTFSIKEIEHLLDVSLNSNEMNPIEMSHTASRRVKAVMFGNKQFTGRDVRERLSLPSNDFSIERRNDYFIFTTKGYGHGVGMSQYGANGMAQEGKTYDEIVSYYYQDVEISNIK